MPTTGPTLRIERLRADISVVALAAQLGVSRQTLWSLERAAKVAPDKVAAYREAVKTLVDVSEGQGVA